jgi:hypothetical protein
VTRICLWTAAVLAAGTAAASERRIERAAGKRRIRKVERITTDGTTLFEAHVEKGLKTAEIVVTNEGAAAKH